MPNDPVVPPAAAEPAAAVPPAAPAVPPVVPPAVPPAPKAGEAPAVPPKKDGEPEPKPKVAPEKYDLKLPEGSLMKPARLEKIAAFAKAKGLSQEDAQAYLEQENQAVKDHVEGEKAQVEESIVKWVKDGEADKEIGGEAFKMNVELAKRVVDRFGTDLLKTDLNSTGLGNHPELVRLLVRIGKSMSEDQLILPGGQKPSAPKRSAADTLYGEAEKTA